MFTKIEPYNDNKMNFNASSGMYELTLQVVKANFEITTNDDEALTKRIKKNSRVVYNFISRYAKGSNLGVVYKLIEHTEEYRKWIYDALMCQMEADLLTGRNSMGDLPPTNRDEFDLQGVATLTQDTQTILYDGIRYGGINLLFAGSFPTQVYLEVMGW